LIKAISITCASPLGQRSASSTARATREGQEALLVPFWAFWDPKMVMIGDEGVS